MAFWQFETYPQEIQNGITLHRAIDTLLMLILF
jgi:acyl carrier protein phosphodiesterase